MTFIPKIYIFIIIVVFSNNLRKVIIKKELIVFSIVLVIGLFFVHVPRASALSQVSDELTTSRPSPSATAAANLTNGIDTFAIIGDLGNYYLASDSAVIYGDTGETTEASLVVASMSAANIPWNGARTVYFTSTVGQKHHRGNAVIVNVTATHVITLTPATPIPLGGHITITFPGSGSNIASPSATTFSFNNLQGTSIICNPTTACAGTKTISAPTITLTTTASQSGPITIAIGCTGTVTLAGICSTYASALINPTASASQCSGSVCTADQWRLTIQTTDSGNNVLESSKIVIGTIQAVQVQATVEPSLTFSITGEPDATDISSAGMSTSCGAITTNSGLATTATFVNLGSVSIGNVNFAAQLLQVSTNASYGYSITSTSSGHLINANTGQFFPDANVGNPSGGNSLTADDTPAPAVITAGVAAFGIHACGPRSNINTNQWVNAGTAGTAKFSNPWNVSPNGYNATLANYSGGPVASEHTVVLYGATASPTTPAGIYSNYFTYVATPNF